MSGAKQPGRLASGAKIRGPKNPAQKPIAPSVTAPTKALETNPSRTEFIFFHVYEPTPAAHNNEMMLRHIQLCSKNGIIDNGTHNTK